MSPALWLLAPVSHSVYRRVGRVAGRAGRYYARFTAYCRGCGTSPVRLFLGGGYSAASASRRDDQTHAVCTLRQTRTWGCEDCAVPVPCLGYLQVSSGLGLLWTGTMRTHVWLLIFSMQQSGSCGTHVWLFGYSSLCSTSSLTTLSWASCPSSHLLSLSSYA